MATNTQRIDALEAKMDKLLSLLEAKVAEEPKTIEQPVVKKPEPVAPVNYVEPKDGQNILIQSLFVGSVILSYGDGKSITLEDYGEQRPVLYRDLISMVNLNKNLADEGYFYITDPNAVHFLGLETNYKKILSYDEIENLCTYGDEIGRVKYLTNHQKSLIPELLAMKIANGERVDFNTISAVGNALGVDVNSIAKRIEKMKKL